MCKAYDFYAVEDGVVIQIAERRCQPARGLNRNPRYSNYLVRGK